MTAIYLLSSREEEILDVDRVASMTVHESPWWRRSDAGSYLTTWRRNNSNNDAVSLNDLKAMLFPETWLRPGQDPVRPG
jgi:hypothetical protein